MHNKNIRLKKYLTMLSLMAIFIIILGSSFAYYNYKKVFIGGGELPILNINYAFTKGTESSLKNITYNGQEKENISINVNTYGNNLSGLVRVKIFPAWQDTSLSNTTYNEQNNLVYSCFVNYDMSNWVDENDWLYLKQPMQENTEVELFSEIVFENLPQNYYGKKVDIWLVCEIYQTNNLPENWRE